MPDLSLDLARKILDALARRLNREKTEAIGRFASSMVGGLRESFGGAGRHQPDARRDRARQGLRCTGAWGWGRARGSSVRRSKRILSGAVNGLAQGRGRPGAGRRADSGRRRCACSALSAFRATPQTTTKPARLQASRPPGSRRTRDSGAR